jgi:hypothetical protein
MQVELCLQSELGRKGGRETQEETRRDKTDTSVNFIDIKMLAVF